jgi:hypothetical protein
MMFRTASRRARLLLDRVGKITSTGLRSNNEIIATSFSTKQGDLIGSAFQENHHLNLHPVPLPAVAYDDSDDYDNDDETCTNNESMKPMSYLFVPDDKSMKPRVVKDRHDVTCSTFVSGGGNAGRGPTSSNPYPAPSSAEAQKAGPIRKVGGGGGGSGRHRCPKCGTTVTFRCDYEENTFYCASCSGWFVANPNIVVGNESNEGDGSPYEEFMAKNGSKKVDAPDILMRHVSVDTFFLR